MFKPLPGHRAYFFFNWKIKFFKKNLNFPWLWDRKYSFSIGNRRKVINIFWLFSFMHSIYLYWLYLFSWEIIFSDAWEISTVIVSHINIKKKKRSRFCLFNHGFSIRVNSMPIGSTKLDRWKHHVHLKGEFCPEAKQFPL